jgi:hypothetical protein
VKLVTQALRTKKQSKIGLLRQLREITAMRFGDGLLDPWEYYFFQVYLDHYSREEKRRFAGWRCELHLDGLLNTGPARKLANDKLLFHLFMTEHGAPLAEIRAVYATGDQPTLGAKLGSPDAAERFLRDPVNMPVFVKPVRGAQGHDTSAVLGPTGDRRSLVMADGRRVGLRDFVAGLQEGQGGFIFQELLRSQQAIRRICGDRLTTVRAIVILSPGGPEILSAVWRVPTGSNVTDNFDVGRAQNIAAGIDIETGELRRIIRGAHWHNIPVDHHPDTGLRFEFGALPDWPLIRELCLRYAPEFEDLRLQHWDIALTDRGPVIMELNVAGGLRTHQIVAERGIFGRRIHQLVSARNSAAG